MSKSSLCDSCEAFFPKASIGAVAFGQANARRTREAGLSAPNAADKMGSVHPACIGQLASFRMCAAETLRVALSQALQSNDQVRCSRLFEGSPTPALSSALVSQTCKRCRHFRHTNKKQRGVTVNPLAHSA